MKHKKYIFARVSCANKEHRSTFLRNKVGYRRINNYTKTWRKWVSSVNWNIDRIPDIIGEYDTMEELVVANIEYFI